jgi:hypothetical protein
MEASVSRWQGGENNGWRENGGLGRMEPGVRAGGLNCSGSAEKETNAICHIFYMIVRVFVYLYAHAKITEFASDKDVIVAASTHQEMQRDETDAQLSTPSLLLCLPSVDEHFVGTDQRRGWLPATNLSGSADLLAAQQIPSTPIQAHLHDFCKAREHLQRFPNADS